MEVFGPWSAYLRKSGGTITGNVVINGTLQVDSTTLLQGALTLTDQLRIIWNAFSFLNPHIILQNVDGFGTVAAIGFEDFAAGVRSVIQGTMTGTFEIGVIPGAVFNVPSNMYEPDPLWKMPEMSAPLGLRRNLLVNNLVFG